LTNTGSGYISYARPDGRSDSVFREADQTPEALSEEIFMRIEKDKSSE